MAECGCKNGNNAVFYIKTLEGRKIKMATNEDRLKGIIVDQLGVESEKVTVNASFINDLGADSLDIVELVMAMEEEFDIEIPDEDAEKIKTVGDAVNYLNTHKK